VKWVLGRRKQAVPHRGMVGIYSTAEGISIAYSNAESHIESFRYEPIQTPLEGSAALSRFAAKHNLLGMPCNVVVGEQAEYTLTLVDTPRVPAEEMRQALPWLVQEEIHFPIEEAVLDFFELPLPRARDNVRMSYVVIVHRPIIQAIESFVKTSGLILKSIDIPEFSLRNIITQFEGDEATHMLIQLSARGGKLMVCHAGQISMIRTFNMASDRRAIDFENPEDNPYFEQLALEVQRSIDYYSSTFRQKKVSSILLMPAVLKMEKIRNYLNTLLEVEVQPLDLTRFLKFNRPMMSSVEQGRCLIAIGAALRGEDPIK